MKSHKIALKLYAKAGTVPPAAKFVEVFHDWIKDGVLKEVLIDVADYGHVHEGPHVLLVGHESDYALDFSESRPGLSYVRKRTKEDAEATRLDDSFARVLGAAALLEKDARLAGLAFERNEVLLKVLDRLNAPNTTETYEVEKAEIETVATRHLGKAVTLSPEATDPRAPFTVRAVAR